MHRRLPAVSALVAVVAFVTLAFINAATTSPTSDELTHLAAGLSYLRTGDLRLNREHPPLLKAIAAIPLWTTPLLPDASVASDAATRLRDAWAIARTDNASQWRFADLFFYGVKDEALSRSGGNNDHVPTLAAFARTDFINDTERLFLRGRTMMILIGALLVVLVFVWARQLWGAAGGVVAVLLIAFDPNFIAHSALVTTDVGITLFITATLFFFWRSTRPGASALDAALFLIAFALAFLAKFSAVLLVPILIAVAVLSAVQKRRALLLIGAAGLAALAAIWIAWGFRGGAAVDVESAGRDWAARRAARAAFPTAFGQNDVDRLRATAQLGVIERMIIAADRINLLPEDYLHGFAVTGATSIGRPAFINGRTSMHGFYSYFGWTTFYKLPLITLIAIFAGLLLARRTESLGFVLIPIVVYLAFAVFSRMNIGHRHILPIFPFLYVLCGSLGTFLARRRALAVAAALTLVVTANVVFLPRPSSVIGRHLSYANEIAGGPRHAYRKITDSNFDWGQDLERLGHWLREHESGEPIHLVYFGNADPRYYGIRFHDLRPTLLPEKGSGYLAVSTADYLGVFFSADRRRYWERFTERTGAELVGRAGYSILIFRLDSADSR